MQTSEVMMENKAVEAYIKKGGKITRLEPKQHSETYLNDHPKEKETPQKEENPEPSAKSCRHCYNYNRGRGTKNCLRCRNYKLMETADIRSTMVIVPMVSELIEAFPAPPHPENDLMSLIRQLSAHNAAMLCMCYYGALSVREMAEVLGISQEATRKKLYRAVSYLRKFIAERYPTLKSTKEARMSYLLSPN